MFFNFYERYQLVGPDLIENADWSNGLAHWQYTGNVSVLPLQNEVIAKLETTVPVESAFISQIIRPSGQTRLVKLRCEIKTENIVNGDTSWKTARVVLVSFNAAGEAMYDLPHVLVHQEGSHDWVRYEKVFAIPGDVSKIMVAGQIVRSTGSLWIKSISLRPVTLKTAFRDYRLALLLVWMLVLLWVTVPFFKSGFSSLKQGVVLILAAGVIFGVLMPESMKESMTAAILATDTVVSASYIPVQFNNTQSFNLNPHLPELDLHKAGHFVLFTLLSIAVVGGRPYKKSTACLLAYLVLFALISEVLQLFMEGRTAQLGDIFIDSGGIITGYLVSWLWLRLIVDQNRISF
ncbi:MAG: VanZ family protein [Methylomicrobium sp.]|nr:VanZ family protein [Methylomicrobium sp.]